MKLNKVTIICLIAAAILTAGIMIVQAAGFVSYEDDNPVAQSPKLYLWDNVRMVGAGLKMSPSGAADAELVGGGILKIIDKDLFVRGLVGFECADYPNNVNCRAAIGNIGNAFLTMDQISSDQDLILETMVSNITINALLDGSINITGKLLIKNDENLIVANNAFLPLNISSLSSSVFVSSLSVDELKDTEATDDLTGKRIGLTLPEVRFDEINESNESGTSHPIMFYPKRLIEYNVSCLGSSDHDSANQTCKTF